MELTSTVVFHTSLEAMMQRIRPSNRSIPTGRMLPSSTGFVLGVSLVLGSALVLPAATPALHAQEGGNEIRGPQGPSPYEVATRWQRPYTEHGYTFGGNSGVFAESPDRIFVVQRGETKLPDPIPEGYVGYGASAGINVLSDTDRRVWRNCFFTLDGNGFIREMYEEWDRVVCPPTDGPGPHRLRINPYDPESKVWIVQESTHQILVFSNDAGELVMTLGERGVPGNDEDHFGRPQDVAFLPDGRILVADGLDNHRVVVLDENGEYISEFGGRGDAPGQFNGIHAVQIGPTIAADGPDAADQLRVYALDRSGGRINVFRTTDDPAVFEHVDTWDGFGLPLSILVNDDALWITDLDPLRFIKIDFQGNHLYTWLAPEGPPDGFREVHELSVDSEGNLYAGDNIGGRLQKLVPKVDADPELLIGQPWVAP